MSSAQYKYRITREQNCEWYYVERLVEGGYPKYISTGFGTVEAAQYWLDQYKKGEAVSNFYQGKWQ